MLTQFSLQKTNILLFCAEAVQFPFLCWCTACRLSYKFIHMRIQTEGAKAHAFLFVYAALINTELGHPETRFLPTPTHARYIPVSYTHLDVYKRQGV